MLHGCMKISKAKHFLNELKAVEFFYIYTICCVGICSHFFLGKSHRRMELQGKYFCLKFLLCVLFVYFAYSGFN